MIEIIPAIMPKSFADLQEKLSLVATYVDSVQLDVMDGKFVKSKSWPYVGDKGEFQNLMTEFEGLPYWDQVDFEIDLMVKNPQDVVESWITAGAARLVAHVECGGIPEILKVLHGRLAYGGGGPRFETPEIGVELGLALNPDTHTDLILPYLEDISFVQFMGIEKIGYQGQQFQETVIDKIRDFHNAHPEVMISVDGGVGLENARELLGAGAKRLISGSVIFESDNIAATIEEFKNI